MMPAGFVTPLPFSGGEILYDLPGGRWTARIGWDEMLPALWPSLLGFLPLGMGANQFSMKMWGYPAKRGGISGSPVVTGAALAKSVAVAAGTGTNPALKRGDLVQIGNYAHVATTDLTLTAGSGTLSIWPELRVAAASAPLIYSNAQTIWRILPGQEIPFDIDLLSYAGLELALYESLP